MRTDLVIRRELPEDRAAVTALLDQAFLTGVQPDGTVSASLGASDAVTDGSVTDGSVTDGSVTDDADSDGSVTDDADSAGSVSDGALSNSADAAVAVARRSAEAGLVDRLWRDADVITELTFVAELEGRVGGQVTCSRARLGGRPSVALGPISVTPELARQGIGAALMAAVIASAEQQDFAEIVLVGDPEYYGHFGFVPASTRGITSTQSWGGPFFQVKPLRAWAADRAGEFDFAPAFRPLAKAP